MKTKLLKNPIGCIKTQNQARELVQNMRNIWDDMSKNAGLHCPPELNKEVDLESANNFFQLAMFVGMTALLDEGAGKVEINGMEED